MKKGLVFIIISVIVFCACIAIAMPKSNNKEDSGKIEIVATLFPQYDFARQIGGDKVNVSLLLPPGTETHTYEPTPQDIIAISNANLFIYTGKYMEPWSERIISGIDSDTSVLDASRNINLIKSANDNHDEEENHEELEEHHHHEYDSHVWLDPQNAIVMVNNVTDELCLIDKENEDYYRENSKKLIAEIEKLDSDIEDTIKASPKNKIAFGGTFAYAYFVNRYNLEYVTAYDSCGESSEPSVAKVKEVIDYMNKNNIKVIFYQELSTGKIASSIAAETGAKKLIFHTVHNATQNEINSGETYISLMRKNLENLKQALE